MSLAMIAKSLAASPEVRKLAMRTANRAAGAINNRLDNRRPRRRRGPRRQNSRRTPTSRAPYPTLRIPGGSGVANDSSRSRRTTLPAAINLSNTNRVGDVQYMRREPFPADLRSESGDNGELYFYRLTPRESRLFPMLAGQASGFTEFEFKRLSVIYVPRSGTTAQGRIAIGFDPMVQYEQETYPSFQTILSLQSNSGPLWQPLRFDVPSQGVKYLTTTAGSPSSEPAMYYNGTLVFALQSDEVIEGPGDLYLEYHVVLKRARLDTSAKTAGFGKDAVPVAGRGNLEATTVGTETVFSLAVPHAQTMFLMWHDKTNSATVTKNGDTITPAGEYESADDTMQLLLLGTPKASDEYTLTWSPAVPQYWNVRIFDKTYSF